MKSKKHATFRADRIAAGTATPSAPPSPLERPPWATRDLDQRIIEGLVSEDTTVFRQLSANGVDEASVRAHAHALGVTHEFIKQCRLSGSRPAMRTCIKCDATFLSFGIHNRLCHRCGSR
jgi:hypothetical protein